VSNRRLTARDYKSVRRGGLALARWRDLGIGLGVGLLVALVIYVSDHRGAQGAADSGSTPTPRHAAARSAGTAAADAATLDEARTGAGTEGPAGAAGTAGSASAAGTAGAAEKYDFYDGLAKFEVLVPEKEHGTRVDAAARVSRPGTYFLQAGSYRNVEDANRVQAQLARQKISANVQRVALDADVWYRIRIGPISELDRLNRVRQQLQAARIVSLVIRVDD